MNNEEFKAKWIGEHTKDLQFGHQCVDLVKQYYRDVYGIELLTFTGSAYNGWNTGSPFKVKGHLFRRMFNLPKSVPLVGDIVFFAPTSCNQYGHTAIVDKGSNGRILMVIEQNTGNGDGHGDDDNIKLSKYNYIKPRVLGWFRMIK